MGKLVEQEWIVILVTGKSYSRLPTKLDSAENGFTLIEMMVAITILAIILGVAVLNIPSHESRYWRTDLDHLVGSLNAAQDEATISGQIILVQIDRRGWRFALTTNGGLNTFNVSSKNIRPITVLPDIYKPQIWSGAMLLEATQFTLGDELFGERLLLPIAQNHRNAIMQRDAHGRFSWIDG